MAKDKKDELGDVNKELAFQEAWDKSKNMKRLTTRTGRLRGQLKPSDQAEGRKILRNYGY